MMYSFSISRGSAFVGKAVDNFSNVLKILKNNVKMIVSTYAGLAHR